MTKIAIIGIGHVGATVAHTIIERKLATELYLFDQQLALVEAEQYDLWASQIGHHATIPIFKGTKADLDQMDILIFAVGNIAILEGQGTRFDELTITKQAAQEWGPRIKQSAFNGVLITITNPCDVITRYLQELTELPKNQVFGTGTSLDTARFQHAVGEALAIEPDSVAGVVLGEHGDTQFIPWSLIQIAQQPIQQFLSTEELQIIEQRAQAIGQLPFTGKGYTSFGIANQAALFIEAICSDSHRIFPVSAYSEELSLYIGQPASIGRRGVHQIFPPKLTPAEQTKWQTSAAWIQEMYEHI